MTALAAPPSAYPTLPADQPWPPQGQWTYADYLRLPDDGVRYEIIEGVLYMTNAPGTDHQLIVTAILFRLYGHVHERRLGAVLTAPVEVHLSATTRPVQPDILFIAEERRSLITPRFVDGAPDLLVEVLSPSTGRRDRGVKLDAYERYGVREYWVVNPKARTLEVYSLERGEYALCGEYGPGERVLSVVLPELDLPVDLIFPKS